MNEYQESRQLMAGRVKSLHIFYVRNGSMWQKGLRKPQILVNLPSRCVDASGVGLLSTCLSPLWNLQKQKEMVAQLYCGLLLPSIKLEVKFK